MLDGNLDRPLWCRRLRSAYNGMEATGTGVPGVSGGRRRRERTVLQQRCGVVPVFRKLSLARGRSVANEASMILMDNFLDSRYVVWWSSARQWAHDPAGVSGSSTPMILMLRLSTVSYVCAVSLRTFIRARTLCHAESLCKTPAPPSRPVGLFFRRATTAGLSSLPRGVVMVERAMTR